MCYVIHPRVCAIVCVCVCVDIPLGTDHKRDARIPFTNCNISKSQRCNHHTTHIGTHTDAHVHVFQVQVEGADKEVSINIESIQNLMV
jgi:hypothetical protein